MDPLDATRSAMQGDGILFIGAGLSFLSRCVDGKKLPDGSSLVDILLDQKLGTGSRHSLDRVSGSVIKQKGVEHVYNILKSSFTVIQVDDKLKNLYSLPWKRIYTTNYDNAIEKSREGAHEINSITIDEPIKNAKFGSIIHLNGYINRISPANLNSSLLLTDTSYASSRLVESGWLSFFEQDINSSRAMFFVGYSLYDLEIDKVLMSSNDLKRRAFFFISPDADQIEIDTLERYGTVVPGGIDTFLNFISKEKISYNPRMPQIGFTGLREIVIPSNTNKSISAANKLTEQLVFGKLAEPDFLLGKNLYPNQPFIIDRQQDKVARKSIEQGPWRDILFIGEIASGKSASTLNIAKYLIGEGYRVFYAIKAATLSSDLYRISNNTDKIVIIFEGYSSFRDEIFSYAAIRRNDHRIILTERTAIHDFVGAFIDKTPHLGPVREIALDKIDNIDAPSFEALTNFGGFWGDRAGSNVKTRQNHIIQVLEGSLYRLLLEIIESKKVQADLKNLLSPLLEDRKISKAFCSILVVNSLGFSFSISEWQYLFERQLIRKMINSFWDQVRHFILLDSDEIYVRHGLISSHVLHAFMADELIRECLVDLYERAEKNRHIDDKWSQIVIELTKFSSIEKMFSGPTREANIFCYFDDIRIFGKTRDNPDYWLQLGIASTIFDELERGKLCFKNAYSRERARNRPNLTRIDNYFSRFEMRLAVAEQDPKKAFALFIQATNRLEKQIFLDTNRHYPFKTGRYYTDIAAKHYDMWNEREKIKFRGAVESITDKALEWKSKKKETNADIEILVRENRALLKKLS